MRAEEPTMALEKKLIVSKKAAPSTRNSNHKLDPSNLGSGKVVAPCVIISKAIKNV
jgi:hypothetical protein